MAGEREVGRSLREFTRQLYAETAAVVETLFTDASDNEGLRLSSVRICCGTSEVNYNGSVYLLPESTPWLAELRFVSEQFSSSGNATPGEMSLVDRSSCLVADWPCSYLQGVGSSWSTRLAAEELQTIADLAGLGHADVLALGRRLRSTRVVEFYYKARAALMPCPELPASVLDDRKVFELLVMPSEEVLQQAPGLTSLMVGRLEEFLGTLVAVVTDKALQRYTLGQLLGR
ncbi:hypothetical protein [Prosthecochloris sp. CIB 2401]|uniref:hypothetical protein n=1 Tax=Prosthecochloris sp. CIB 2401 TaxID=1868325 RepID=UPI00080A9B0E|nr:hypothetical protein [Prosthecochloris sp. CIB 2401]ANT64651.1 hypothetical protein Ptc2401_00864 [Prosthecochloris sp. CIB 2401]